MNPRALGRSWRLLKFGLSPAAARLVGTQAFVPVRLGTSSLDGQVQVLNGLQAGDTVVVYSQKAVTAGARVQVVDALVKPAPQGSAP